MIGITSGTSSAADVAQGAKRFALAATALVLAACFAARVLDVFVLPVHGWLGKPVLSKALGLLAVLATVRALGLRLPDLGLKQRRWPRAAIWGAGFALAAVVSAHGAQLVVLHWLGDEPVLAWTGVNLAGLGSYHLLNATMEELLFRGLVLQLLLLRFRIGAAIALQACAFAAWHWVWPFHAWLGGELGGADAVLRALHYSWASGVMAVVMALFVLRTGSLWAPIAWHAVFDLWQHAVIVQSPLLATEPGAYAAASFAHALGVGVVLLAGGALVVQSRSGVPAPQTAVRA